MPSADDDDEEARHAVVVILLGLAVLPTGCMKNAWLYGVPRRKQATATSIPERGHVQQNKPPMVSLSGIVCIGSVAHIAKFVLTRSFLLHLHAKSRTGKSTTSPLVGSTAAAWKGGNKKEG